MSIRQTINQFIDEYLAETDRGPREEITCLVTRPRQRPARRGGSQPEQPATDKPAEPAAKPAESQQSAGAQFLAAFGAAGGVWFAEGKSFAEAAQLQRDQLANQIETLTAEIAQAKRELAIAERLPALRAGLVEGLARFAASIELPPAAIAAEPQAATIAALQEPPEPRRGIGDYAWLRLAASIVLPN